MQSTLSLPLLPGPLYLRVVAPDRVLSMGQIEQKFVFILSWILKKNGTEIFEREQLICIKMDVALTYNGWCAIRPNQTKQLIK